MSWDLTPVFGLQGVGRWDSTERPKSWRQFLLKRKPKGSLPLTAMMSKAGRETVTDVEFNWHEKDFATQSGSITDIYTDEAMSSALATHASAAGATLYLKVDATADNPLTNYILPGAQLLLTSSTNYRIEVRAKVVSVDRNGASSGIRVRLLTADSNQAAYSLSTANFAYVMPTTFPEFGGIPKVISYKPGRFYNYCSIKKEAMALSRTAMKTKGIRPNDKDMNYVGMKMDALEALGVKMEQELLWGARYEETNAENGQLEWGSMGIDQMLTIYGYTGSKTSYKYDATYTGQKWREGGYAWLKAFFMTHSQYADLEKMWHVVGNGTILGITELAETNRFISLAQEPRDVEFGLSVRKLITPWGVLNLFDHSLLNINPAHQYAWYGIPEGGLTYAMIADSDVQFLPDQNYGKGGMQHVDGRYDLWLVQNGYFFNNIKGFFHLHDVGVDNAL